MDRPFQANVGKSGSTTTKVTAQKWDYHSTMQRDLHMTGGNGDLL